MLHATFFLEHLQRLMLLLLAEEAAFLGVELDAPESRLH